MQIEEQHVSKDVGRWTCKGRKRGRDEREKRGGEGRRDASRLTSAKGRAREGDKRGLVQFQEMEKDIEKHSQREVLVAVVVSDIEEREGAKEVSFDSTLRRLVIIRSRSRLVGWPTVRKPEDEGKPVTSLVQPLSFNDPDSLREPLELPAPGEQLHVQLLSHRSTALIELEDLEQRPVIVPLPQLTRPEHQRKVVPPMLSNREDRRMNPRAMPAHLLEGPAVLLNGREVGVASVLVGKKKETEKRRRCQFEREQRNERGAEGQTQPRKLSSQKREAMITRSGFLRRPASAILGMKTSVTRLANTPGLDSHFPLQSSNACSVSTIPYLRGITKIRQEGEK